MANTTGKILIDVSDNKDLIQLLDKYRTSLGWTWKRLFLIGVAEVIAKNGDNPDLVLDVVNHLGINR